MLSAAQESASGGKHLTPRETDQASLVGAAIWPPWRPQGAAIGANRCSSVAKKR
jgi:hypothetical protein